MKKPKILYKYYSLDKKTTDSGFSCYEGVKGLIKENKIYFPSLKELNDPFEANPQYSLNGIGAFINTLKLIKRDHPDISICNIGLFKDLIKNRKKYEAIMKKSIDDRMDKIRIFCTTSIPDSILMWSHYANGHKGICVGFDVSESSEISKITSALFKKVSYSDVYPTINPDPNIKKQVEKLFYTKYVDWKYEKEWRSVVKDDREFQLPEGVIKCIILGGKVDVSDLNDIKDWLKGRTDKLEIKKATVNSDNYKINIDPFNF